MTNKTWSRFKDYLNGKTTKAPNKTMEYTRAMDRASVELHEDFVSGKRRKGIMLVAFAFSMFNIALSFSAPYLYFIDIFYGSIITAFALSAISMVFYEVVNLYVFHKSIIGIFHAKEDNTKKMLYPIIGVGFSMLLFFGNISMAAIGGERLAKRIDNKADIKTATLNDTLTMRRDFYQLQRDSLRADYVTRRDAMEAAHKKLVTNLTALIDRNQRDKPGWDYPTLQSANKNLKQELLSYREDKELLANLFKEKDLELKELQKSELSELKAFGKSDIRDFRQHQEASMNLAKYMGIAVGIIIIVLNFLFIWADFETKRRGKESANTIYAESAELSGFMPDANTPKFENKIEKDINESTANLYATAFSKSNIEASEKNKSETAKGVTEMEDNISKIRNGYDMSSFHTGNSEKKNK